MSPQFLLNGLKNTGSGACLVSTHRKLLNPEPQELTSASHSCPSHRAGTPHTGVVPSTDCSMDTYVSFIPKPARFSFYFWLTLHPRAIKTWSEKAFAGHPRLNHLNAHLQLTASYCCCFWHMESLDENKQILGKNDSRKSWIFMACTQKPD